MKKKLSLLLLLVASSCQMAPAAAPPAMVLREGDNIVVLRSPACSNPKVLAYIPAEYKAHFHAGNAKLNGKTHALCWALNGPRVIVVFDDGDGGSLPTAAFMPAGDV